MISSTDELASLSLARAYIDAAREQVGSLGARELIDTLDRVDRAYQEFPELALERPRSSLAPLVMLLLDQIVREPLSALQWGEAGTRRASDGKVRWAAPQTGSPASLTASAPPGQWGERAELSPTAEVSSLVRRFRELPWDAIEPVVGVLRQQGRTDTILEIISAVLDHLTFFDTESAAGLGELLADLLADEHPLKIGRDGLTEFVHSARRRLKQLPRSPHQAGSREGLLAMAERVRPAAPPPAPPKPHPGRAWPSGRLSFDEFLLQWPCEIEFPADLDDEAFVDEAYRAILLRGSAIAERDQYLKLLRDGAVSREWIIEDLLASQELHSLERHLRVVYGGQVITEPGTSGQDDMPVVSWPALG
jgi:hypothetical protein